MDLKWNMFSKCPHVWGMQGTQHCKQPFSTATEVPKKGGTQDATIPNSRYPVPCHQMPLPRFVPDSWCLFGGGWALAQGRPIMLYRKP